MGRGTALREQSRAVPPPVAFVPVPVLHVIDPSPRPLTRRERAARAELVEIFVAVWGPLLFPAEPPPRPCPEDFDEVYARYGFDECETHYAAGAKTVRRWLHERGADRLRKARQAHLRAARAAERAKKLRVVKPVPPVLDDIAVDPEVLAAAAHFLRTSRNGGWFCAATGHGDWWLGSTRRSPAQIVEKAVSRGFDPANVPRTTATE